MSHRSGSFAIAVNEGFTVPVLARRATPIYAALLLLVFGAVASAASKSAPPNDEKAVRIATAKFYLALNKMFTGDLTDMIDVWSHADDVTYMGPGGGVEVGWTQVLESWKAQAAMKLGGSVEPADVQVTVGTDLAITSDVENGENTNAKGEPQKLSIRATNIFRKEHGTWKMIGHHTDLLPYLK